MSPGQVKTFSFFRDEPLSVVPFVINGETFHAKAEIPGMELLSFVARAGGGDADAAIAVRDFLKEAIIEFDAFEKLTRDPMQRVGMEQLTSVAEWIVELAADRPTEPSTTASAGLQLSGAGSTERPF